ncbi:MAG: hypothetical protein NDI61_03445 [Bdellovibrionaceae bacterium]|nr:hypothetical protein [Pseudobdellovibrionaceae bacterium]
MQTFLRSAMIMATLFLGVATAQAQNPVLVSAKFDMGFMPNGFDTNDQVQFAAEGLLSDSCHKPAPPVLDVDLTAQRIHVAPKALRYAGPCLDVITPYNQVIDVGLLPEGLYTVFAGSSRRVLGRIPVRRAMSAAPDDHLYAPVSQAFYRKNTAFHSVILTGEFTNSCIGFKENRVTVNQNVITVQPITEFQGTTNCRTGVFPFQKAVRLPPLPLGRYLLHVRSLNATAVNSIITVL